MKNLRDPAGLVHVQHSNSFKWKFFVSLCEMLSSEPRYQNTNLRVTDDEVLTCFICVVHDLHINSAR